MTSRLRTPLLVIAALLAGPASAQQASLDGIPTAKQGIFKITCTDANNSAAQPCFFVLAQGGSAASPTNPIPVADGSDPASPAIANPGVGARGWLASIAASNAAITTATGAQGDSAYNGTGNGSVIALGKGQYAILANLYAALGTTGDAASATTSAAGTQIALSKALRDRLNTSLPTSVGQKTMSGSLGVVLASDQSTIPVSEADGANATIGAKADTAYGGTGAASVIALLKGQYGLAAGPTPAGTNVIGKVGIDQTTPGTSNGVQLALDGTAPAASPYTFATGTNTVSFDTAGINFFDLSVASMPAGASVFMQYQDASGAWQGVGVPHYFLGNIVNGAQVAYTVVPAAGIVRVPVVAKAMRLVSTGTFTGNVVVGVTLRALPWAAPSTFVAGGAITATLATSAAAYVVTNTTLSTTAAQIIAAGAMPSQRTVKNTDASITVYLGPTGVATGTGFPLKPGESITFDARNTSAALFAVAASGSPVVSVLGF